MFTKNFYIGLVGHFTWSSYSSTLSPTTRYVSQLSAQNSNVLTTTSGTTVSKIYGEFYNGSSDSKINLIQNGYTTFIGATISASGSTNGGFAQKFYAGTTTGIDENDYTFFTSPGSGLTYTHSMITRSQSAITIANGSTANRSFNALQRYIRTPTTEGGTTYINIILAEWIFPTVTLAPSESKTFNILWGEELN